MSHKICSKNWCCGVLVRLEAWWQCELCPDVQRFTWWGGALYLDAGMNSGGWERWWGWMLCYVMYIRIHMFPGLVTSTGTLCLLSRPPTILRAGASWRPLYIKGSFWKFWKHFHLAIYFCFPKSIWGDSFGLLFIQRQRQLWYMIYLTVFAWNSP